MTVDEGIAWRDSVKDDDGGPYPVHNYQVIDPLIAEVRSLREELAAAESAVNDLMDAADEVGRLREGGWKPIETAPDNNKIDYFFCIAAWGSSDDKNTGPAMRYKGQWFTASVFYSGGPFDQRQYEFREHGISPTHWKPLPEAPHG